jgi:hypothetical protein
MRHFRLSVRWVAGLFLVLGALVLGPNPAFAQTDVLYVVNNNVGIGTASPYYPLDVAGVIRSGSVFVGGNAGTYILDFLGDLGADRNIFRAGISSFSNGFTVRYLNSSTSMVYAFINGNVGIGVVSPGYPLQVGGAYCTVGGVWTNASSRAYKQDIRELSTQAAEDALEKLSPVTYAYTAAPEEHHVGFIAEDAPDLVATADHKGMSAMDVVAVLTKVVQDQKTLLEEQQKAIAELTAKVAELEKRR